MEIEECRVCGGKKDRKLEVGGGGASCRSSVTRSLFDCWSEFEIALLWTNRNSSFRLDPSIAFRSSAEHVKYAFKIGIK